MEKSSEKISIILTTTDNSKTANEIVKVLLKERLAACISKTNINSSYWWRGKIEEGEEILLIIKTSKQKAKRAIEKIKELHNYEVPELLELEASSYGKYTQWLYNVLTTQYL